MTYGVQPTGFVRKRLPDILTEIEEDARGVFGAGVIQSAQSPLGQLNGLYASIAAKLWEIAEDVYQSYDPDQSEGVRLDQLAKLRLLERTDDELDVDLRRAITNADRSDIDVQDLVRAVAAVPGVSFARAHANDKDEPDARGIDGHCVAVVAAGGSDEAVAQVVRRYVVPGVGTWGNVTVETVIDGFCRTVRFTRPTEVRVRLVVEVRSVDAGCDCTAPPTSELREALFAGLVGKCRPGNGETLTLHPLRLALAGLPGVEIVYAEAAFGDDGVLVPLPRSVDFLAIPAFALADIDVRYAG